MKTSLILGLALFAATTAQAERQVEFTYYGGTVAGYSGYSATGKNSCCMAVSEKGLAGMKLVGMRVEGFADNAAGLEKPAVWLSSKMDHSHDMAYKLGDFKDGIIELAFDEPVILDGSKFYAGYDVDVPVVNDVTGAPLPYGQANSSKESFCITYGENGFADYTAFFGPATITLLLTSDQEQAANAVRIDGLKAEPRAMAANNFSMRAIISNTGSEPVSTLSYSYSVAGQSGSGNWEFDPAVAPGFGNPQNITLNIPAIPEPGVYPMTITIDRVNGVDNAEADNVLGFDLNVYSKADEAVFNNALAFSYTHEKPSAYYGRGGDDSWYAGIKLADPAFAGMKLMGFKAPYLGRKGTGNYTGWASTKEFGEEGPDMGLQFGEPVNGTLSVVFDKPCVVPDSGLYVGYGLDVIDFNTESGNPIPMAPTCGQEGSAILNMNGWFWSDMSDTYSLADFTVYLQGEITSDNLSIGGVSSVPNVVRGYDYTMAVKVSNGGNNEIESISYSYVVDGKKHEKSITLDQPLPVGLGTTSIINLLFDSENQLGRLPMEITLDKVNKVANNSGHKTASCTLTVLSKHGWHKPLMEEATGTWCGWCPRGWIAMRELNKTNPNFIGVVYHNNDVMTVTEDYPFEVSGFPGAAIDRGATLDPYYGYTNGAEFGIQDDYAAAAQIPALANISLKTQWVDDTKTQLRAIPTASFNLPLDEEGYKIGLVLVGNGYHNPEYASWAQHNYYSGKTGYAGLEAELTQMPSMITDITYDDIAIDVKAMRGVDGSLPKTIEEGKDYSITYTFDTKSIESIQGEELIENPDNLAVVTFVVAPDGTVLNAAKVAAGQESGIDAVGAFNHNDASIQYFDLMGRQVSNPHNGIFIKRQGSNTVKVRL